MAAPEDTLDRSEAMHRSAALVRKAVGRLSWGLADQAVSSLTNFAVGILVARELGTIHFGIFSLAYVTYGVALNFSRGLATDPLVVRYSGVDKRSWRGAVVQSTGTATLVGVVTGVCCALAGLVIGGTTGAAFVALGLVLPGVLLQDAWRYAFFANGQGGRAFANDLVWAIALVPCLAIAATQDRVTWFVVGWGLAAAVAALVGCLQTRLLPRPAAVREWVSRHRDLGPRYLVENVSLSGSSQLKMYGVGAIAGLAAVGTIRGSELLLGPFFALLMGISLFAVPEAARVLRRSVRSLRLFCAGLGGAQALAALLWGAALLLLLPDAVGEAVLGPVWATASQLIVPATLSIACAGLFTGASAGLRALGAAKRSLRAQLFASVTYFVGGITGAFFGGALGASWGTFIATFAGAVVWWWQLNGGLREFAPKEMSAT